jgi:hypothetical protein
MVGADVRGCTAENASPNLHRTQEVQHDRASRKGNLHPQTGVVKNFSTTNSVGGLLPHKLLQPGWKEVDHRAGPRVSTSGLGSGCGRDNVRRAGLVAIVAQLNNKFWLSSDCTFSKRK